MCRPEMSRDHALYLAVQRGVPIWGVSRTADHFQTEDYFRQRALDACRDRMKEHAIEPDWSIR